MRGEMASRDRVERIVYECLERLEAGESSAVDDACRRFPEDAAAIRQSFDLLERIGLGGAGGRDFPERLGEFRLLERLGQGGMGVVYLAEQEPLGRRVALKVVRPDRLYFAGSRERFQREVEAVARLKHPGIVPVYTVGEDEGVPYFAMEWIEGCPLSDVVKRLRDRTPHDLTAGDLARAVAALSHDSGEPDPECFGRSWVEATLRIARQVAGALSHAHAHGVLHRDVKPSNILLTPDGRALLVDFGLASTQHATELTASGSQPGSLPYMSPEQLAGRGLDERTDVYSLGVTLYELWTLRSPFAADSEREIQRRIVEGAARPPRVHNRAVPGDAEIVCLAAIDRSAERRYASMGAFGADLANVLALRPVVARRASASLRAVRFVQRHPTAATAALLGFLLIVVAPLVGYFQVRAEVQRTKIAQREASDRADSARRVVAFLCDLFRAPSAGLGRDLTVREVLDIGAARIRTELPDRTAVRAALLVALGDSYVALGHAKRAEPLLAEGLEILRELHGPDHTDIAAALESHAALQGAGGAPEGEEQLRRTALAMYRRVHGAEHSKVAACTAELAMHLRNKGAKDESLVMLDAALAMMRRCGTARQVADLTAKLGGVHFAMQEYRAAGRLFREAITKLTPELGEGHPEIAFVELWLGRVFLMLGKEAPARAHIDAALGVLEAALEAGHPAVLNAQAIAATVDYRFGELTRAAERSRAVIAARLERFGAQSVEVAESRTLLGMILFRDRQLGEADRALRAALATLRARWGAGHDMTLSCMGTLARVCEARGEHGEARRLRAEMRSAGGR